MQTVFLTGFPGFIGSSLMPGLLNRYPEDVTLSCLVQKKFLPLAEQRARAIEQEAAAGKNRIKLLVGDITRPDLGLERETAALQADIVEIYHLAAVYDLGVKRDLAYHVNVEGTNHMLDFAAACPNLIRFQYMSTCFVSGRYPGTFTEQHLAEGQEFNNHYEATKFLAEAAVQAAMSAGLPATIYRPGIVVGDSRTGETQKYDGPYYVIQWILRQRGVALVPVAGNPAKHEVNVVPRDFVVDAITYLSGRERSLGQVYHICDPQPLTVDEMLDVIEEAAGSKIVRLPLPKSVAKGALAYVPGVERFMRIEPEAIEYFVLPTRYTCDNTLRDLDGTGIACPPFTTYVGAMIHFIRAHPEISAAAMV